ncbi:MAG TPA: PEP/pyruvate-binding domain-containing protein [Pirellulales bacterium]|nr:PEP/pyruvate-binding domain-containing protein [Pirellulales bacterium]
MSNHQPAPQSEAIGGNGSADRADRWVHFLGEPLPCDEREARRLLGGKSASLDLLRRAGLRVPPAFTITTAACRQYYAADRRWPAGLWQEIEQGLARLATVTGRGFAQPARPLTVAVRSGAVDTMPGLLTTILHCGLTESLARQTDEEWAWEAFAEFLDGFAAVCLGRVAADRFTKELSDLPARQRAERWLQHYASSSDGPLPDDPAELLRASVTAVFDSWRSEQSVRYRELRGWESDDGTAVIVQAMFAAEVAGVVFSRDPFRPGSDAMLVEAAGGLGRRVVAGRAAPAQWTIERDTLAVRETQKPECDCRAMTEFARHGLERLGRDALTIEALLGAPADVEFGYAAGELVFFQARPLDRPPDAAADEETRQTERRRLLDWARQGRRLWVRHDLGETLPVPTPLTWDLWRQFMTGRGGFGHLYRRLGYRPSRRVCRDGFLELIAGRIYADPQRMTEMLCAGYPLSIDVDALRQDSACLDRPPTRLDLEQLDPWFLLRWPWVLATIARSEWRRRRLTRGAAERFDRDVVPRIGRFVEDERRLDLGRLSLDELVELFRRRRRTVFDELAPETFLPGALGVAAWRLFTQGLEKIDVERHREIAGAILTELADPVTCRQQTLFAELAAGKATITAFLHEFGHRGPGEMDLSSPRWRERPAAALDAARRWAARRSTQRETPAVPPTADVRRLCDDFGLTLAGRSAELLEQAFRLLPYREIGKHELLRAYDVLRDVLLELARRTELGSGIFYLTVPEVERLHEGRDWPRIVSDRRERYAACRRLYVPPVFEVTDDLPGFGLPPRPEMGQTIAARPLSRGRASGAVLIVNDGHCDADLCRDRIVVASSIDPASMPALAWAAGLVVEQAGALSHIALLARQLAIPAVAARGVVGRLVTGEKLSIDADEGRIERRDITTDGN